VPPPGDQPGPDASPTRPNINCAPRRKGLLITTGTFTTEAKVEATRDGAPPIDLIDGQNLSDLLKTYGLGVTTTIREVEDIGIDPEFFKGM
jgi:restriction system protein